MTPYALIVTCLFMLSASAFAADPAPHIIKAGDSLTVNLWGEQNASYDVRVSQDGKIYVPILGQLTVVNLTLDQAVQVVNRAVRRIYKASVSSGVMLGASNDKCGGFSVQYEQDRTNEKKRSK